MQVLQKQLQDQLMKNVGGLKVRTDSDINTSNVEKSKYITWRVYKEIQVDEINIVFRQGVTIGGDKVKKPETEEERRARVRRRFFTFWQFAKNIWPSKSFYSFLKDRRCDVWWFRWRVLALKVKFGLGANFLAVKKRNLNDITTFIDQETEVVNYLCQHLCLSENHKTNQEATKEDQMDLEGKCMRKKVIRFFFSQVSYPPIQVSFLTSDIQTDKRHFRRGGVRVGCAEGRDGF